MPELTTVVADTDAVVVESEYGVFLLHDHGRAGVLVRKVTDWSYCGSTRKPVFLRDLGMFADMDAALDRAGVTL